MPEPTQEAPDTEIGHLLVQGGQMSVADLERALEVWRDVGGLLTDVLLTLGIISERALLKHFAALWHTRFVTAAKLKEAKLDEEAKERIGVRDAERVGIVPLWWDPRNQTLHVIAAAPLSDARVEAALEAANTTKMNFYLATWAAVRAGIRAFYYSDTDAFAEFTPEGAGPPPKKKVSDAQISRERDQDRTRVLYRSDDEMLAALRKENARFRIAQEFHRFVRLERDIGRQLKLILRTIGDLLSADVAIIELVSGERAVRTRIGTEPSGDRIPRSLFERAVVAPDGLLLTGLDLPQSNASESVVVRGVKSALAMRMESRDELFGVIYLESVSTPAAFDESDLALLRAIAAQAATVIHNARLLERVRAEAEARTRLARFLPPALVERAVSGELSFTGEHREGELTVLFADIRGFTAMVERLAPADVVEALNRFYEAVTAVVFDHGGMVDKLIGDAVMAVWGGALPIEDHPERAVSAAVKIQERISEIRIAGEPLHVGIGIDTGRAIFGPVGTATRLDYTAIGPAVNNAAHLCEHAGRGEILLSSRTAERARRVVELEPSAPLHAVGMRRPLEVFSVATATGLPAVPPPPSLELAPVPAATDETEEEDFEIEVTLSP